MKNNKHTKLFVLILSLALLIGTAVAFAASAEETESYEIEAINVIYKDQIFVAIAVDAPVEKASEIEVGYTFNGESYTAEYHSNMAVWEDKGDDTLYPVFVTIGIPAKDQGEDVIAEAHAKGSQTKGNTKNVSVASYLYQRLYKDGFIAATEEKDIDKRDFYLATLDYISLAQKVLYNNADPAPETPRTLVNNYVAVYAQDAIINGGDSFFLMKEAGNVTLEYTGTGTKAAWNVNSYNGSEVTATSNVTGNTVPLASSAIITPVLLDFEIGTPTIVETFENSYKQNMVACGEGTIDAPSFSDYVYTTWPGASYTNTTGETVAELVEYTTTNGTSKALNMFTPGRYNADGSYNGNNRAHAMVIKVMEDVVPEENINATAFEFDFKLGFDTSKSKVATSVYNAPVQFTFDSSKEDGAPTRGYVVYNVKVDAATGIMKLNNFDFEIGNVNEFITIKFVVDYDDELIHVYANDVLKGSIDKVEFTSSSAYTNSSTTPTYWPLFKANGVTRLGVGVMGNTNAPSISDVYIDNIKSYNTYCLD